jgi:selenocysteine lyase/cysteine desulfurase
VVAVPGCHWTDGSIVDLERVGKAARTVGAAFVVDASQSSGACALDITQIQPDFLVTVGYKWLLGPYGLGYLYAAPRWRECGAPIERSWLARAGSEDFSRLTEYTETSRAGARRFDMGEFPRFVSIPMAVAALEQILAWGVDRIQATLLPLTSFAAEGATQLGGTALPAAHRVGHMVGIRFAQGVSPALMDRLAAAKVYVSIRGDSIRVAPHLYNDRSDISRFLATLGTATGDRDFGPLRGFEPVRP